jgi:hypothetical protein
LRHKSVNSENAVDTRPTGVVSRERGERRRRVKKLSKVYKIMESRMKSQAKPVVYGMATSWSAERTSLYKKERREVRGNPIIPLSC